MTRCLASDLFELLVLAVFVAGIWCVADAVMTTRASIQAVPALSHTSYATRIE